MVVKITFTPLYGVHTRHQPLSYLLSIDGFNILLDCGWNSFFDPAYLSNLAQVAPSVHVVLLSHPDISHLGALPYAVANLGLKNATVFSTLPVWRMGQMFMYDAFLSLDAQRPFTIFNLDHVDAAFEIASHPDAPAKYKLLKYQQRFPLDHLSNGEGIIITPHTAGHMLGGTVWHISKQTENIVYAVDFNHRRERHLNPTALSTFSRPSHLIVSAARALTRTETLKASELNERIKSTLRLSGNVLIPVDTAGRIIELAVQLHDVWATDRELAEIPLVILHDLSARTFEFARSMIEWMSDEVVRRFDISRDNLFVFKHVKLCQNISALDSLSTPMVVLATSLSMEMGYARLLFARWASDARNAVMLVDRPEPDTLYAKLFDYWEQSTGGETDKTKARRNEPLSISLVLKRKEFLQGEELAAWREQERARKALEREEERAKEEELRLQEAEERENQLAADAQSVVQDPAASGDKLLPVDQPDHMDMTADPERYDELVVLYLKSLGLVPRKQTVEMFPFAEPPRPMWDDYGQVVDTTRFMIGEDPGEGAPIRNMENGINIDDTAGQTIDTKEVIPTKYVEEEVSISVECQIYYLDNSGLSDGDSLKRLIKEVEPRHATLVAGTEQETMHLKQYLLNNLYSATSKMAGKKGGRDVAELESIVSSPTVMETVDITSHSSVLELRLQDNLVVELGWNRIGSSGIAFVDAMIADEEEGNDRLTLAKQEELGTTDENDVMEIDISEDMEISPRRENRVCGHPTVFVGTIMLNRLKDVMVKAGMKAEIAGGALCVENSETGAVVLLKKVGAQHIVMEGALSEEFFKVQDLLYDELIIPQ